MMQGVFGLFNAGYGEEVTVYHSSSVGGGVWVGIKQRVKEGDLQKTGLNGEPCIKPGEAAAHLSIAQAQVLRAALDNFLAEAADEE